MLLGQSFFMWNYYGSKSLLVDFYPPPRQTKIIEPFAGTARYALKYWENEVLLVDKFEVVVRLWKWLQQCSPNDILKLPKLKAGQKVSDLGLDENERMLVGYLAAIAVGRPRDTVTKFAAEQMGEGRSSKYKKIADNLHKIRHWEIMCGDFSDIENQSATWFIDPPYQYVGEHQYKFNNKKIDFKALAEWCKSRIGQSIVCENSKADWLPFSPLKENRGANNTTFEVIWTNVESSFMNRQMQMFL